MKEFCEVLKEIRKNSGLSQLQIAKILNVDRTLVSQWERGICEPSINVLRKLCIIFDISADEILSIETKKERKAILDIKF